MTCDESMLFAGFFNARLARNPLRIGFGIADRELVDLAHQLAFQMERQVQDLLTVHKPAIFVAQQAHDLVGLHVHDIA